ncbi:lysozyme inhibitor LprI family protein [Methylocapsa aurea]|uniref:lysozyme inhibitor LprI family protein n=1 Tax=Methylocapsa aurea TaxID=663610 RepID=UPI00068AD7B2|nr:lysozyme inhibitor LprI family protein [Methylocapsa aurea]
MHRILSRGVALAMVLTPLAPVSAQTQMELNVKAGNAFTKADKRLNDIYQKLMAKISSSGQASLRDVEKIWIQFRDQECAFETLATVDGSIHPMVLLECKTRLTDQRIKDLEAQLNCEEGDLSCGGQ